MVYFKLNLEIHSDHLVSAPHLHTTEQTEAQTVEHLLSLTQFPWVALRTQSGSLFFKAEVFLLSLRFFNYFYLLAREVGDTQRPCISSHLRILRSGTHGEGLGQHGPSLPSAQSVAE